MVKVNPENLPRHVAIVMDGNGRWAKQHGKVRLKGHKLGADAAKNIISYAAKKGIACLSLFAFSSENWQRPSTEVGFLMDLFFKTLSNELNALHSSGVKITFTGSKEHLSSRINQMIEDAKALTSKNQGLILNIVFNYGGRWDIFQAAKAFATDCVNSPDLLETSTQKTFSNYLSMADLPEPDLFIRTSGEYRLSNFFLWQLAYAELYFCPKYWPDFDEDAFDDALIWFQNRERRFGQTSEQLSR